MPLASLLGQLLNLGRTGAALKSKTPDRPLAELTASLCDTAAKAPLVCVVDRADALVGTWWSPLLDQLAVRISHGLPLFMFLAVDGGPAPGQHTEDEPDALNAARRLINERLGLPVQWHAIEPVDAAAVAAFTGPAQPALHEALLDLTEARAGWVASLWEAWREHHIVTRPSENDEWRFATQQARVTGRSVADIVDARIAAALGDDPAAVRQAHHVLTAAAIEGETFTADVVAGALGMDAGELVDWLDDTVATEKAQGPLVEEAGSLRIPLPSGESATMWRYRFTSSLFHDAIRDPGRWWSPLELENAACAVAGALSQLLPPAPGFTLTLARIYALAGMPDAARKAWLAADTMVPQLEEAQRLQQTELTELTKPEARRAAGIFAGMVAACSRSSDRDGLMTYATSGIVCAQLAGLDSTHGDLLNMLSVTELYAGKPVQARAHLDEALELWTRLGRLDGMAEINQHLGWVAAQADRRAEALEHIDKALELLRKSGIPDRVLQCLELRLNIALRWGDIELAEATLDEIGADLQWADDLFKARLVESRGALANMKGNPAGAMALYERAASLYRDLGETELQASAERGRSAALISDGQYEAAKENLERSILSAQATRNIPAQAEGRQLLAHALVALGEGQRAHAQYTQAAELYDSVEQPVNAENARRERDTLQRPSPP